MHTDRDLPASSFSPRLLARAPHRLMFFVGASNVALAMLWWAAWLVAARWPVLQMPQPEVYAGWLHAFVMQYQMLASFIFGFLLTVFPRWMGLREFEPWRYLPVGLGLFGGQLATLLGAPGWNAGIVVGVLMTLAGWLAGVFTLAPLLWRERGVTWHARSCFGALILGLLGLAAWTVFLLGGSPLWAFASIKVGTFGFLLPMYLTVAHRMFPFFTGNVVAHYTPWRPLWLLAAFWALVLAHLALELVHAYAWLWIVDLPLLFLAVVLWYRWWPRGKKPALLTVLFLGLAWLPAAFLLYAAQSIAYLQTGVYALGRAPAHALFVGFFGSVLIAMVTRVTQGHSGRALVMPGAAWFAFTLIQGVTLIRIAAEFGADGMRMQAIAAIGWLIALTPWVIWLGRIYLSPRTDGKPG
ncbi:NnrS family protein [Agrilutibacter solisilvae]|uniref:NnrS family protein n=1 Tax=Agrilutibacter solisilvae TaxID=2763317 RepID=A0A974XXK4_9GAMM|nr:NnrS family protein [Lysobacter solisilvae]QSX77666.1 NnrS family protein [Lysobacter solisilvae]